MGNIWHDMREDRIQPENFVSVIEITKGSKKKYELDKETGFLQFLWTIRKVFSDIFTGL